MNKLFHELRRRNVFHVAGLYVGVAWIGIEVASVLMQIFEWPKWVTKAIVGVLMGGFPVALVLAWFYEFTSTGIKRDEDVVVSDVDREKRNRVFTFVAIGVLVLALGTSVVFNLRQRSAATAKPVEQKTLLIADFDNKTGDPIFGGTLEQAMIIGLEGASFISAYPRESALKTALAIKPGSTLNEEMARLVAVREGIQLVLAGTVAPDGSGYTIAVRAIDTTTGEELAQREGEAKDKLGVLAAVGGLANEMRASLGDVTVDGKQAANETFTAVSLEAVHEYTVAQELARQGKDAEAIEHYRAAVKFDPGFARAHSGWGLSAFKLGRRSEADAEWKKAMAKLDTMTDREKYRTMGVYYSLVANNRDKAIENYEALVTQYPADGAGHNNLAVAYFMDLNFEQAVDHGRKVLNLYPKKPLYRANYALYAMYAGDMTVATTEANAVLKENPGYAVAYLPLAVAATVKGDLPGAEAAYGRMRDQGAEAGASLAATGLADLDLMRGDAAGVPAKLAPAIAADEASANQRGLADKLLLVAESQLAQGQKAQALETLARLDVELPSSAHRIAYARLMVATGKSGKSGKALEIADELAKSIDKQSRAWGRVLQAEAALADGKHLDAIDKLQGARELADLWFGRMLLGQAYLAAGHAPEALAEFEVAQKRSGEAVAMYLDDVPTLRNLPALHYWLGRAQQDMKLGAAAKASYEKYLAMRPSATDAVSADARTRVAAL